jgi:predicted phage-related endonuclease
MAKLPTDISETIWRLKGRLADAIDNSRSAEFYLFDKFGETERTIVYLDDLQSVAEQATDRFSQLSSLQIRVLNVQPHVPEDMLELVTQVIANTEARLPALEQSILEIRTEWELL